jgi:hypothetical protein
VIFVLAFATIELVSLVVYEGKDVIIAIPTVDDVRALAFLNPIVAFASVNDVIALIAKQGGVVAWPGVDDVVADSCEDKICSAKPPYLPLFSE